MKILFPVQVFYPSQAGGPANTVYFLAKHLQKNGHEPIVIATDSGLAPSIERNKWVNNEAGQVTYIRTRHMYFPFRQTLTALWLLRKADAVHLSSFFFPPAFITGLAAWLFGKKIAWSARGELDDHSLSYSRFRKKPVFWLIRKIIGRRPLFHSTSDEETDFIKLRFGTDASVVKIPNFVELPPKHARTPEEYLLYLGRIHPKKGVENLIRGAAGSKRFRDSKFTIKIAGTGPKALINQLDSVVHEVDMADRVKFLGHIEGDAKTKLYANAYFTFMPSYAENFGNVVVESLGQGTPVAASVHSPWQVLEENRIGFWTDNAPEELSRIIDHILQMETAEYEGYRKRARPFVDDNFDIRQNFHEWIEFYEQLENR